MKEAVEGEITKMINKHLAAHRDDDELDHEVHGEAVDQDDDDDDDDDDDKNDTTAFQLAALADILLFLDRVNISSEETDLEEAIQGL